MKERRCKSCDGYGEIEYQNMTWNGPDIDTTICPDCLGRGYFLYPDPNDLLKELCNDDDKKKLV